MKRIIRNVIYWLIPSHWFLRGDLKELSRIEWFIEDDYIREKEKCELLCRYLPEREKKKKLLDIDRKYGKISSYEYELQMIDLDEELNEKERENKKLEVRKKYKKISEKEYEKYLYTLNGQPWVRIENTEFNPETMMLEIEVDWNQHFIEKLNSLGYTGKTDEEKVDLWLTNVFRSMIEEDTGMPFVVETGIDKQRQTFKIDEEDR